MDKDGAVKYPTKKLECWQKFQELRKKLEQDVWAAKDRGELLILTDSPNSIPHCLPSGLGVFRWFGGVSANVSSRVMENPPLLMKCLDAAEQRGLGTETCGLLKVGLGALFLDMFDVSPSGKRVRGDFQLDMLRCQSQGKTSQLWSEYYGTPGFLIETPPDPKQRGYFVAQMHDSIDWMEKVTSRKYDDERLLSGLQVEWETKRLWAQICEQQKAVPAPLDLRRLLAFAVIIQRGGRHDPEMRDLLRMTLDEVKQRVKDGVGMEAEERVRLTYEGQGTWYPSSLLRYPGLYGGTYIGSYFVFGLHGAWQVDQDGSLKVAPSMEELDLRPRNRDEALHAVAALFADYCPHVRGQVYTWDRAEWIARVAEDWHADASVINNDRGCVGGSAGNMEAILALKDKGIPAIDLEIECINPRKFDDEKLGKRLADFLQSMGLKPLQS